MSKIYDNALRKATQAQEFRHLMASGQYATVLKKYPRMLEPDVRKKLREDIKKNKISVQKT